MITARVASGTSHGEGTFLHNEERMTTVRTRNSVYHLRDNSVMLESGTPSGHLPFGQWVEVDSYAVPVVGQQLWIKYLDGKARFTTSLVSVETQDVGNQSSS